jgi:hypothetical protein
MLVKPHRHSGARVQRANPESILPHECWEKWIPGLRLTAHPGMTKVGAVAGNVR